MNRCVLSTPTFLFRMGKWKMFAHNTHHIFIISIVVANHEQNLTCLRTNIVIFLYTCILYIFHCTQHCTFPCDNMDFTQTKHDAIHRMNVHELFYIHIEIQFDSYLMYSYHLCQQETFRWWGIFSSYIVILMWRNGFEYLIFVIISKCCVVCLERKQNMKTVDSRHSDLSSVVKKIINSRNKIDQNNVKKCLVKIFYINNGWYVPKDGMLFHHDLIIDWQRMTKINKYNLLTWIIFIEIVKSMKNLWCTRVFIVMHSLNEFHFHLNEFHSVTTQLALINKRTLLQWIWRAIMNKIYWLDRGTF